jgi:hypothetical protein
MPHILTLPHYPVSPKNKSLAQSQSSLENSRCGAEGLISPTKFGSTFRPPSPTNKLSVNKTPKADAKEILESLKDTNKILDHKFSLAFNSLLNSREPTNQNKISEEELVKFIADSQQNFQDPEIISLSEAYSHIATPEMFSNQDPGNIDFKWPRTVADHQKKAHGENFSLAKGDYASEGKIRYSEDGADHGFDVDVDMNCVVQQSSPDIKKSGPIPIKKFNEFFGQLNLAKAPEDKPVLPRSHSIPITNIADIAINEFDSNTELLRMTSLKHTGGKFGTSAGSGSPGKVNFFAPANPNANAGVKPDIPK